jgi:hypothetical protein
VEQLFGKLVTSLTDPVNIVLLLWIWWFIRDRGDLIEINDKLLAVQQSRGETLSKIALSVDNQHEIVKEMMKRISELGRSAK